MGYPFNGKIANAARTDGGVNVDRAHVYHYDVTAAAKGDETIKASVTLLATAQTVTSLTAQPDVPRRILLTKNANATVGDVVITGTNIANAVISETIALPNSDTTVVSTKAFKTITSIAYPIRTAPGDWIKVGTDECVGLPDWFTLDTIMLIIYDGAAVAAHTLTADSNEVEKNLLLPTGTTFNGVKVLHVWWFN
jgi:putative lipase involved disintegration of autophagic bodies